MNVTRLATLGAGTALVLSADLATKAHARTNGRPAADSATRSLMPRLVHDEHPGHRALGLVVAGAPLALAGALVLGGPRVGAIPALASAGAMLIATGGVLNGGELAIRGSNTNPFAVRRVQANVADVALYGGFGLAGLSLLPFVARTMLRH